MEYDKFETETIKIINKEIEAYENLKSNIHIKELYHLFNFILSYENPKLVFSGVGKSGHIAKKVAASFSSVGFQSIFLNPLDAAHGDLGMIRDYNIIFLISNSGNTKELLDLIPSIKELNIEIVSVTSNSNSELAKNSKFHINTFIEEEICPLNLAPTLSTTITLSILDNLMVLLMKEKNFSKDLFAKYHPSGILGKSLLLKIKDILKKEIYKEDFSYLNKDENISNLIYKISKLGKGLIPILDEDKKVIGVISDGDIRRAIEKYEKDLFDLSITEIITYVPIVLNEENLIIEALNLMKNKKITAIPVVNKEGKYVGIINIHDIFNEGFK